MAKEKSLFKTLKACMGNYWDVQRHEDKYEVGIPDVSFGFDNKNGWIELKRVLEWPRSGSPLRLKHFSPQQKNWLCDRQEKGGNCWLLLQVDEDFLLFKGNQVRDVGDLTKEELIGLCYAQIKGSKNLRSFIVNNI